MERKGRKDLINNFVSGSLPTTGHFRQLIDSMLNLEDDDFQSLLLQMGGPLQLHVNSRKNDEKEVLIEFHKKIEDTQGDSVWKFVLSHSQSGEYKRLDILELVNEQGDTILKIPQKGPIEVNSEKIKLNGQVILQESIGDFKGAVPTNAVPADGEWHAILEGFQDCHMFEVVACAGNPKSNSRNFSMIKSTVALIPINKGLMSFLFPDKSAIQTIHSYSGSSRNKIDLKWIRKGNSADLMIRTRCDFKGNIMIHYRIKRIWSNELMLESES